MNRKMIVALVLAAALVPLAPSGIASHTGMYSRTPVEHDDQGRSVEPDFQSTSVFGPLVNNKVVDTNLDGIATVDAALGVPATASLAPGCTDDSGRRPSGLCGLWTIGVGTPAGATVTVVPPGIAGVQGMGGNAAPGPFTPTKSSQVRFLDTIWHQQQNSAGSTYVEVNRKLDDSGLRPVLASIDPNLANDVIVGGVAVWAWYGKWQDKNGNGVIDSLYDAPALTFPPAPAGEEFVWYGNCRQFPDAPAPGSISAGFCALDTEAAAGGQTRMLGFMFPGNHHSFCGGFVDPLLLSCGNFPADIPGRQVIHFVGAVGAGPPCAGALGAFCAGGDLRTFDEFDETTLGDPLLGPQNSVAFDQEFNDRTGEPRRDVRQWVYGLGWTTYFYDQSLVNSLVAVTAVGCAADQTNPNKVQMGTCRSTDVDSFKTFSPAAESLLQGTIKPAARANWVFVRDTYIPMQTTVDGVQNNRAGDATPATGPVDDRTQNPGYGREPNDALDSYPAAVRGACADSKAQFQGWCNNYNAHKTGANAFGDLIPVRAVIINRPVGAGGGCVLCVAGTFLTTGYQGESPAGSPAPVLRAEGDYRNTLGAGQYIWGASFGQWQDKAQVWKESFLNPLTQSVVENVYTRPADGWVGNVVNATGTWYYRGYTDEACATDQGAGLKTYGACHPYLDGAISSPQQMGAGTPPHGEWSGRCDGINGGGIVLTPVDGVWSVPVIVFRNHQNGIDALALESSLISKIEDKTGTSGPIVLNAACSSGSSPGLIAVADLLILPMGNAGETLRTSITVKVGAQTVTDVDTYYG